MCHVSCVCVCVCDNLTRKWWRPWTLWQGRKLCGEGGCWVPRHPWLRTCPLGVERALPSPLRASWPWTRCWCSWFWLKWRPHSVLSTICWSCLEFAGPQCCWARCMPVVDLHHRKIIITIVNNIVFINLIIASFIPSSISLWSGLVLSQCWNCSCSECWRRLWWNMSLMLLCKFNAKYLQLI